MTELIAIPNNRDEIFEEIKQIIDEVVNDINSFEKIRLLGVIASSLSGGVKITTPTLPNIIETSIEYAISIALASDNDPTLTRAIAEDMANVLNKLRAIREKYNVYALTENIPKKYTEIGQRLRSKVIENTLTVRGEGYQINIEEIFLELYDAHIDFFLNSYNFFPEDILEIIDYIEDGLKLNQALIKQDHKEFLKWIKTQDINKLARKYPVKHPSILSIAYQAETGREVRFEMPDEQFRFAENELSDQHKEVIRTLSMTFGDNSDFLDPRFKALPLNDTLINSKPIVYDDKTSSYYCFSSRILHRNLFNIAEGLIERANSGYYHDVYLGKGNKGKSTYFETKVSELLHKIMPNNHIHSNLKYKIGDDEFEIDILIEAIDFIYIVEVKSGTFSNASKRGAIKSLKSELEDLVGYAATQVSRTEDYIISENNPSFFYKNGNTVNIAKKSIRKIVVSFASIIGITNQLYSLTKLGIMEEGKSFPLALSVFDLMVLSEIFEDDEKEFASYFSARIPLYKEENFIINNEIDFLGLYLSRDFKSYIEAFIRGKRIELNSDHRNKLDNYFNALYEGIPAKKPKKLGI